MCFIDSLNIHTSMKLTLNRIEVQQYSTLNAAIYAIEISDRIILDSFMRLSHIYVCTYLPSGGVQLLLFLLFSLLIPTQ